MKRIPAYILMLFVAISGWFAPGCSDSDCPLTTLSVARFDFLGRKKKLVETNYRSAACSGIII